MNELGELGRQLVARIRTDEPQFLVEFTLPPNEIQRVRRLVRARLSAFAWSEPERAVLALVAVQAAAEAQLQDEGGFRQHFYSRLGVELDERRWDSVDGPALADFLCTFFGETPRVGPYRYVAPVYAQAGVTAHAMHGFASSLAAVRQRFGPRFLTGEYLDALRVTGLSRRFLESETGCAFARRTLEVLDLKERGLLSDEDLATLPGYRPGFWTDLQAAWPNESRPTAVAGFAEPPALCLDADSLELVLRFDRNGVRRGEFRMNGVRVLHHEHRLETLDQPGVCIRRQGGDWVDITERMRPWWKRDNVAALFRVSDGGLVATEGRVRPGRYYYAAPPDLAPPEEAIRETLLWLNGPAVGQIRVWVVELLPGTALGPFVVAGVGATPTLTFDEQAPTYSTLGRNIFVGRLPSLCLDHWTEQAASSYWVWTEVAGSKRRVSIPPGVGRFDLGIAEPCQGSVRLEPRGFSRSVVGYTLDFAVLPAGIRFLWQPPCAGMQESLHARPSLPAGWTFLAQGQSGRGLPLELAPGEVELAGTITNGSVTVDVAARAPRVDLDFPGQRPPVIWLDHAYRQEFRAMAPPGVEVDVWLGSGAIAAKLLTLGSLGRGRRRTGCLLECRDALKSMSLAAGAVYIRCADREIATGWSFADAGRLKRTNLGAVSPDFPGFDLPAVGLFLRSLADLHLEPCPQIPSPPRDVPRLRRFFARLASGAIAFDGAQWASDVVESDLDLSTYWRRLLDDFLGRDRADNVETQEGRVDRLRALIGRLPVPRWRELIERKWPSVGHVALWVREWRAALVADGTCGHTHIYAMRGGPALSEGARRYAEAMNNPAATGAHRARALVLACRELERIGPDADDLVRVIGAALLKLGLYHLGEREASRRVPPPPQRPPFGRLFASLGALDSEPVGTGALSRFRPPGLSLSDLSPAPGDSDLERSLMLTPSGA